jgi:hypothetical protein
VNPKFRVVGARPLWYAFRTQVGHLGTSEKCQYQKCDRLDLFDYHVGAGDERRRDHEVERFRGFEIDG